MWHIEIFSARSDPAGMVTFFRQKALPYLRHRGFNVKFFATQHELGPKDFWFLTEAPDFADLDQWPERAEGEPEGAAIMREMEARQAGSPRASVVSEITAPGAPPFRWDACPMWHVELFNSAGAPGELEAIFRDEVLSYWRSRGFVAHLFKTQQGLGPRLLWLLTGLDRFGSFDEWGERALGEERGRELMGRIDALIIEKRAHVIKNVEA